MAEHINYEIINLHNLDLLSLMRQNLWEKIVNSNECDHIEILILDSKCPNCSIFVKDTDKSCTNCGVKFCEKVAKAFIKDTSPKRGKKFCPGCEFYVAVRTFVCDCGWDFKNEVQRQPKEINTNFVNVKKKKASLFRIENVKNLDILIKNDIIKSNFAKILKECANEDILSLVKEFKSKRDAIFVFNKKLAYDYCNKFYPKSGCVHLKKEDFIAAASIGLLKAIDHYNSSIKIENTEKSVSFSTYATYWIKREIIDQINKREKDIRIPDYIINIYKDFTSYYNAYIEKEGSGPSLEEIMEKMNVKRKKAEGLVFVKSYEKVKTSIEDIGIHQTDPNSTRLAILKDCNAAEKLTYSINENKFELGLIDWDRIKFEKEGYREIFYNLYGLNGYEEENKTDLSSKYSITKTTINKIEEKTLERIRRQMGVKGEN